MMIFDHYSIFPRISTHYIRYIAYWHNTKTSLYSAILNKNITFKKVYNYDKTISILTEIFSYHRRFQETSNKTIKY